MTRTKKTILISVLMALLLIVSAFGLFGLPKVNAEEGTATSPSPYTQYPLTVGGGDFGFTEGAAIQIDERVGGFNENNMVLGFEINTLTRKYDNLLLMQNDKIDNKIDGKEFMYDRFIFNFTLYRCNDDANSENVVALENISIQFRYKQVAYASGSVSEIGFEKVILREKFIYYDEEITLIGFDTYDYIYSQTALDNVKKLIASPQKELVSAGWISEGGLFNTKENETSGIIAVKTGSPYTKYFVRFDYDFYVAPKDDSILTQQLNFTHYYPQSDSGSGRQCADSSVRSISGILENMNNAGVMDQHFNEEELELATNIVTNTEVKSVRVQYLVDLEGTHFAEMYETSLTVPVRSGDVNLVDVTKALGKDYLHAINGNSIARGIKKNDQDVFVVEYGPIWLRAFTEGSQYYDYFLDSNVSYRAFYQPYVNAGVITEELFDNRFTNLVAEFPALYGKSENQIYGFWGLAMMPNNYDLNDVYKEVFSIDTVTAGIFNEFTFTKKSSREEFNQLLNDYNFSWFKVVEAYTNIFTGLANNFTASVIMFCATGEDRTALIGSGGQKDPGGGGAIVEDNAGLLDKIKDWLDTTTETVVDLGKGIGSSKVLLIIAGIVVLAVVIGIKTGFFKNLINGKYRRK